MDKENGAVDNATIMALREDGSLLRELRDLFASEAPEQLQRMLNGYRLRDCSTVAQAAHRLKGTAVTFGAEGMQRICIEIEGQARKGALDGVERKMRDLSAECDRVLVALDAAIGA